MLTFERVIHTIDAHTAGEPLRIITSGMPPLRGETILDKRRAMLEQHDHLRKFLMLEPRGHNGMYGCIITPPVTEDGHFGVIFMHNEGYSTMCGHGIIGVTRVAVETGLVQPEEETNLVRIDSPAGRVTAKVHYENGDVARVSFENVPSFVYASDVHVTLPDLGELSVSIAFGGAFYAFVDAAQFGVDIVPEQTERIVRLGMGIKHAVMDQLQVEHPLESELQGIYGTIVTGPLHSSNRGIESKNITIFADAQIDRSPTGTGTSARLALLHQRGQIDLGHVLVNRSVLDTAFEGRVLGRTRVGDFDAVRTEVSGTAYIMGFNQLVLEPGDPLPGGFRLAGEGIGVPD